MNGFYRGRNFLALCATASTLASPLMAQDPSSATSEQSAEAGMGEIIVTAQKREQSLQAVPIAASAMTGDALKQKGAGDIRDLTGLVPNLTIDSPAGNTLPKITIRGIGNGTFVSNTESAVATYLDEFVLSPQASKLSQMFDLERVEVLRGPQGTLYGKNSTGGAINLITKRPSGDLGLDASGTVARYGAYDLAMNGEAPLTDELSVRVSMKRRYRDGYGFNTFTNKKTNSYDSWAGRVGIRYKNDVLDAYLKVFADDSKASNVYLTPDGINGDGSLRADNSNAVTGFIRNPDIDIISAGPQTSHARNKGATLNIEGDIGNLNLTSISGYLNTKSTITTDADSSPFDVFGFIPSYASDSFSQELRLSSQGNSAFTWLAGVSFSRQVMKGHNIYTFSDLGLPGVDFSFKEKTISYAVFFDGTYDLGGGLSVIGGVRVTKDKKTFATFSDSSFIGPYDIHARDSWVEPAYRAGLNYQLDLDTLLYVSYGHSYRSGAFDTGLVTTSEQFDPVKPEFVDNYEFGVKTTVFDRRLRLAAALFYMDFKDQQLPIVEAAPGSVCCTLVNAGRSRIYGLELEGMARLMENLDVQFQGTVTSAKYTEFTSGASDFSGTHLRNVPKYELRISPEYRFPVEGGQIFFAPEVIFKGKSHVASSTDGLGYDVQKAFQLLNGQIGFRADGGRYSAALFGKNLTNKRYLTDYFNLSSFGYTVKYYAEPSTWGITLGAKF